MFVGVAEIQSFARAAEGLHVSPAAVSFQIRQIEDMSGFTLFERIGRQAVLTEAGSVLLAQARIVLQALRDADQGLMGLRGAVAGRVSLGAVSTAKYIVPHVLARFQAQFPGVAIELDFGNREQIADGLARGRIDLAVMGQLSEGSDVMAAAFAAHPSVIIAPPGHRFAGSGVLALSALAAEPMIVREEGSGTRRMLDQICHEEGIVPRLGMTTSSNETIKQAVMAGMGVALISRHTIGLELALGLLRILPVEGFPRLRSWVIAWRRSMPMMPAHMRLRDFLRDHGQGVIDDLEAGYRAAAARSG
jgi:DNA-binding transcriptional LysR family regulator